MGIRDEITQRWLSVGKAARYAGVCHNTMRAMADRGDVRVRRTPGGHRRIDIESLDSPSPAEVEALAIVRSLGGNG